MLFESRKCGHNTVFFFFTGPPLKVLSVILHSKSHHKFLSVRIALPKKKKIVILWGVPVKKKPVYFIDQHPMFPRVMLLTEFSAFGSLQVFSHPYRLAFQSCLFDDIKKLH